MDDRHQALDRDYELVINLEDEIEVANFVQGAVLGSAGHWVSSTSSDGPWAIGERVGDAGSASVSGSLSAFSDVG